MIIYTMAFINFVLEAAANAHNACKTSQVNQQHDINYSKMSLPAECRFAK